ncbi:MAG: DUF1016 N-terminal domain-containing protein [Elusimicrobiota bacterium]
MPKRSLTTDGSEGYKKLAAGIRSLLVEARGQAARSINAILTVTYWEIGRRIVEFEQAGEKRAAYGEALLERLSQDLTRRFGRGFGLSHVRMMRKFYLAYREPQKGHSLIGQSEGPGKGQSPTGLSSGGAIATRPTGLAALAKALPLSWTHYARLPRVKNAAARRFYEAEALRGGWSIRRLDRQIGSRFYERTALSRNKTAMLKKGAKAGPGDRMTPEEQIKDPYVLEFLDLKDEHHPIAGTRPARIPDRKSPGCSGIQREVAERAS